ncbi:MAG: DUF2764 domain-containing protein [Candidatus Brocadiaceae bacterium]|nr:DUF2764 domain-containing protein [Candidatus Brocadiaceae bacterium]
MAYYYLVSSLLPLSMDKLPPYTPKEFYETCKQILTSRDHTNLVHIINNRLDLAKNSFIKNWQKHENQLKQTLARARMKQPNPEFHSPLTEGDERDPSVINVVNEAIHQPNPMEKERVLDRYRWRLLDELVPNYSFEIQAIFSYIIKLKIATRWQTMEEKKGMEIVVNLSEKIYQAANQKGLLTTKIDDNEDT